MIRKTKNLIHFLEAELANFFYGNGKRKIPTIGVTGTDGKTTTASLLFHILKTAGLNPAMITTVGAQIGDKIYETGLHTTTPSAFTLQRYIKKAVDEKCDYLILEITSHALDQNRTRKIDFKIGILTNVTHEHLDYHGSYKKYLAVKSKLLKKSDICVLNKDDDSYVAMQELIQNKKVYTYSTRSSSADFVPGTFEVGFPENFSFNYENFLAAAASASILGVSKDKIYEALLTFRFPSGRQEIIFDKNFRAVIDFAHTPNSFARILPELKKNTKGRLIHVFGAAGKRDASKRPLMGKIAGENDDVIILTAEDPRSEKISQINTQIKIGITGFTPVDWELYDGTFDGKILFEIDNRAEAIKFACSIAQDGDTVVATGKGHEKSMNLGHGEIPWSEHAAFEDALKLSQKSAI